MITIIKGPNGGDAIATGRPSEGDHQKNQKHETKNNNKTRTLN